MAVETTQWIAPDGTVSDLDVDWNAKGRFMPPPTFQEDLIPGQPGSVFRNVVHAPRDFTIRVVTTAADEAAVRTALRSLVSSMDPTRGEGTLRVTSPLGDVREIGCRYKSGLEVEESIDNGGPQSQLADITFHAFDPYWRDASDSSQTFEIGAAPVFFPIFPIQLTSSQIVASATVTNDGDVPAWPVWTIQGPGSVITLRNTTTGRVTVLEETVLGAGESIVIDTRPTHSSPTGKTITKQDGTNLFSDLTPQSALWELVQGTNSIQLEMAGAIVGASSLTMSWRRKWLAV
jgi:phage-related protein